MRCQNNHYLTSVATPLGLFHIYSAGEFIKRIFLPGAAPDVPFETEFVQDLAPEHPLTEAVKLIKRWLDGKDVRITACFQTEGTAFQREVWSALAKLPRGEVVSYSRLAQMIGKPGAARAVGQAMAANPIPLLIPCHRVIAADGSIGGFGGREELKRQMLALEGVIIK
ncbi:MAG: methylated-DNA--[protein]-cysteine S-methyltransferase [Calditrichaeota bacterium]|nr:methylated-DNA--[protein]-cysteine S-methyltransferase [Calditrichota bacterium]